MATFVNAKAQFTYDTDGADWPSLKLTKTEKDDNGDDIEVDVVNQCGGKNQSPIDLPRSGGETYAASKDNLVKWYDNKKEIEVKWNDHTSQITFDTEDTDAEDQNTFGSQFSVDMNKAPANWDGVQFHFHTGSEHTVDGERFDLEMHTVHYPKLGEGETNESKYIVAAVGILFSVENFDEVDEGE